MCRVFRSNATAERQIVILQICCFAVLRAHINQHWHIVLQHFKARCTWELPAEHSLMCETRSHIHVSGDDSLITSGTNLKGVDSHSCVIKHCHFGMVFRAATDPKSLSISIWCSKNENRQICMLNTVL